MCQATPPAGASSNPTGRGPGNGIGAIGNVNYGPAATQSPTDRGPGNSVGATPASTAPGGSMVPLGANAVTPATNQSFAQQGFSGVGTPLGVPYGTTPASGSATGTANVGGIVGPRMMDTGPLFGSAGGQATPTTVANAGTSGIVGPRTMDTGPLFGSQLGPAPTEGARAPFPETSQETSDPYILRDQMYGLNPTPVNNVSNALMRRYRSYYR